MLGGELGVINCVNRREVGGLVRGSLISDGKIKFKTKMRVGFAYQTKSSKLIHPTPPPSQPLYPLTLVQFFIHSSPLSQSNYQILRKMNYSREVRTLLCLLFKDALPHLSQFNHFPKWFSKNPQKISHVIIKKITRTRTHVICDVQAK